MIISKIGYNSTPTFQARVAVLGSVLGDPNFKLEGNEFEQMCKMAESIGDDKDLVIISATKSQKVSSDEAAYDVFMREANITALVGGKIHAKTFEQTKISADYNDAEYWNCADVDKNRQIAQKMFNTNLFEAFKSFLNELKN